MAAKPLPLPGQTPPMNIDPAPRQLALTPLNHSPSAPATIGIGPVTIGMDSPHRYGGN
jgi:hypothetical protein